MDTVDSVGAYWSFYSIWNSLNVLLMTQSDAPNEGREEKIATQIARKIAAIPENKPEHAADHKLRAIEEIIDNTIKMVSKELRDQLSKERSEANYWANEQAKTLNALADRNAELSSELNESNCNYLLIVEQLEKEREMRKELLTKIKKICGWYVHHQDWTKFSYEFDIEIEKAANT